MEDPTKEASTTKSAGLVSVTPRSSIVTIEDYLYHAALQRHSELENDGAGKSDWFSRLSSHKGANIDLAVDSHNLSDKQSIDSDQAERENASRALRLASWSSVFYLITTDILGMHTECILFFSGGEITNSNLRPI